MTSIEEFTSTPCPQIDPLDINAYFELMLDELNPAILRLDTSWGCTSVDLTAGVKQAETITHLAIVNGNLQYNREDYGREGAENGGVDCITGDELSQIISMRLLKDVDQTQQVKDGMVYMWNSITNLFEPWDLKDFANVTNNTLKQHQASINVLQGAIQDIQNNIALIFNQLSSLEQRMTNLENRVTVVEGDIASLKSRVSAIENAIYNWGADKTTPIARGSVNKYSGTTTAVNKSRGIFTHDPNINVIGDTYEAA